MTKGRWGENSPGSGEVGPASLTSEGSAPGKSEEGSRQDSCCRCHPEPGPAVFPGGFSPARALTAPLLLPVRCWAGTQVKRATQGKVRRCRGRCRRVEIEQGKDQKQSQDLTGSFFHSPLFHKHLVAWIKRGKKGQRRGWGRFLCCVMGGKG